MNESPDLDAIKMFVGQLPKHWTEEDVRTTFQEFGPIYSINILRDKVSRQSRGCCFITFYTRKSALEAQNACHNIRVISGMSHPIQMKPADNENRHERKIFVGMLTKSLGEEDLKGLFLRFGLIEEASILRDGNGISRGCGFVTFASKSSALNAIKNMHQSTVMESCSSPMVVKIADIQQKEKQGNVPYHLTGRCSSPGNPCHAPSGSLTLGPANQSFMTLLHLLQQQSHRTTADPNLLQLPLFQNHFPLSDLSILNLIAAGYLKNDVTTPSPSSHFDAFLQDNPTFTQSNDNLNVPIMNLLQNFNSFNGPAFSSSTRSPSPFPRQHLQSAIVPTSQAEGPDGSNLFIYHLPQDFRDADLIQCFSPYGLIVSARVFIDKNTNLSKCFGFVSYNNGISAQLAINALNGFQIGSKRLKVQLKRPKDKPY